MLHGLGRKNDNLVIFLLNYRYLCTQKRARHMTEVSKKYRLNSMEEPTDEMLQELMEDVAKAARESSARAEAEKQRRLQTVAQQ